MARRALLWRGPDDSGLRLQTWLFILAAIFAVARLFERLLPAAMLVPPALTLAVAIPVLRRLGDRLKSGTTNARGLRILEMTAVMVVFACWSWAQWRHVLRGIVPIDTADHQFMMGRAQIIWEGLRRGKWLHWTHLWQGGDSLVDLYPIEVNLLTVLFHALAPRGTRFVTSYSVFVIWTWWLRGVGAYYVSRRFSGPVVALLLACASLYEVGDIWDGVWNGTLYWGMVHNSLALTFGLFATALVVDLVRGVSGPRFVACALLVAVTACGHALGLLLVVVQTAALGLAILVGRGERRTGAWALAACASGLMLAGVWILPFSHALQLWGYRVAMPGVEYRDLGTGLFNGHAPTGNFITFVGFGIVAVAAAVVAADVALAATAICTVLLVLLSLSSLMVQVGLLDWMPSFLDGQPRRMLTVIKTTSLPSLAWLLDRAFSHLRRPSSLSLQRVSARAVVLALLCYGPGRALLTGWGAIGDYLVEQGAPDRQDPGRRSHTDSDFDAVTAWLKEARAQDPSPTPWRTMISLENHKRHPYWAEGIEVGVPFVDEATISSNFLTFRPREFTAVGMRDWNIKYLLIDRKDSPIPELVERFRSGPLRILENPSYDDRYVVAPAGVTITGLRLVDDEIRFDVAGAPPEGADLQIRTAWFPRWRARLLGQGDLRLTSRPPRASAKPKQDQLFVRAGNGSVVVSCDGVMPRFWPGLGLSVLGAAIIAMMAAERGRERVERSLASGWRAASTWIRGMWARRVGAKPVHIVGGLAGLAMIFGVGAAARGGSSLALPAIEGIGGVDVYEGSPLASAPLGRCEAEWWRARYHCTSEDADVDSWLGSTAVDDSTGERPKLWPGTRVMLSRAFSRVRLHYSRLRLRGKVLRLRVSSWGKLKVSATVDSRSVFQEEYSGDHFETVELPDWVPYAGGLDLDIVAVEAASKIIFRGDLVSP